MFNNMFGKEEEEAQAAQKKNKAKASSQNIEQEEEIDIPEHVAQDFKQNDKNKKPKRRGRKVVKPNFMPKTEDISDMTMQEKLACVF